MKKRIYILSIALASIAFISSCGAEKEETTIAEKGVSVQVATPVLQTGNSLMISGKVEAVSNATLSTRQMGFVDEIHVNIGEKVSKGQLLLSITNEDLRAKKAQVEANISEASAALKNVETNYNRFKTLLEQKSISQKEMDDMTMQYEMTKSKLSAAQQMKNEIDAQMDYANLKAPFDGVITNKFIKKGDMANPGMPLIALENPNHFEVIANVPESDIATIKTDNEVKVLIKSINKEVKGTIAAISKSASNTGGQFQIRVNLEENLEGIYSGMFAALKLATNNDSQQSALMVDKNAIIKKGDLKGLYVVSQQNTATLRWVRLGRQVGENMEVLSGINNDEQYIVSHQGKIFNGAKVSVK